MALFVSFLGASYPGLKRGARVPATHPDFLELKRAERLGTRTPWTISAAAEPGDRCLFYYKSPLSAFVASATLVGRPQLETRGRWRGHHMAEVGFVRLLPRPVSLSEIRAAFPEWGWPRAPRRSVRVPEDVAGRLLQYVNDKAGRLRAVEIAATEGLTKETVRLTRSRSRALHQYILDGAKGRCECCCQDFSVLQWTGLRAPLHVHHRRQLALSKSPRTTRARDLGATKELVECYDLAAAGETA